MARDRHTSGEDRHLYFSKGIDVKLFASLIDPQEFIKLRTTSVMWGIPCDEIGYSDFWIRYCKHQNKMPWDDFAATKGTYLPKARNFVHSAYLSRSIAPLLMMLDSDVLFPDHLVERLMQHNLPVVGGWYKDKIAASHHPIVFDFLEEKDGVVYWKHRDKPGQGVEQVDGMGAGCWLIKREVAEALGENPYDMQTGGEDMVLSRKLMKLGIPMYVDWSINCAHIGVGIT